MTTRLLASFKEFDSYSKDVLSRRSRRNKVSLGEKCSTNFDELGVSFGVQEDWSLDLPCNSSTPRSQFNIEIVKDKNPVRRQRKAKYAPPPSHREPGPAQTVCSKVCIGPFTSQEEFTHKTDDSKGKEGDSGGFMVVRLNKPESLVGKKYAPHRTKWSRELEQLAPMDVNLKSNSKALTGGALHYTSTSHWSSHPTSGLEGSISAFTEEESGHFTLPGSVGKVVTEQLQQGNIVRVTTSGRRSEENPDEGQHATDREPMPQSPPLCLDDELERNHARVLSLRASTAYKSMPIVSETFPVVYNAGKSHHKPFDSPGFHTPVPTALLSRNRPLVPDDSRRSKVYSTIVRLTDTMQEKHAARLQRMSAAKRQEARPQSEAFRVVSADGALGMLSDQDKLCMPSRVSGKSPATPILSLKQCPIPFSTVGAVLNGMNPKHNSSCIIRSPNDANPPHSVSKTKVTFHGHPRPDTVPLCKTSDSLTQKKEVGFVFISKPLMPKKRDVYPCLSRHRLEKKVWHPALAQPFHSFVMSPVTDLESAGTGSIFASRPSSHMNSGGPSMTYNSPNTQNPDPIDVQKESECSEHSERAEKDNQLIISIPTAEIV